MPRFGEIGDLVLLAVSDVHTPDTQLTLPPIFAERGIRFGGTARCKYTNLPDFHGEHSQH